MKKGKCIKGSLERCKEETEEMRTKEERRDIEVTIPRQRRKEGVEKGREGKEKDSTEEEGEGRGENGQRSSSKVVERK